MTQVMSESSKNKFLPMNYVWISRNKLCTFDVFDAAIDLQVNTFVIN